MLVNTPELRQTRLDSDETPVSRAKATRAVKLLDKACFDFSEKIAVLSTITADPLSSHLYLECAYRGINADIKILPIGQLEQQAFDEESDLNKYSPSTVILLIRLADVVPSDNSGMLSSGFDAQIVVDRVRALVTSIHEHNRARIVVSVSGHFQLRSGILIDQRASASQRRSVTEVFFGLTELAADIGDMAVVDLDDAISRVGRDASNDSKLYFLGRVPWSHSGQIAIASSISRNLAAMLAPAKKCLVLDADNTLWGGVLGEDGIDGIQLSDSYPGNAYKSFQAYALELKRKGILLALASKNNAEDVIEVLNTHSDCLLSPDDFAAMRVNWIDKATNIAEIAKELNIGLSSLVFYDDNPAERQWVNTQLPQVHVVDVPQNPVKYVEALEHDELFDTLVLSESDLNRSELYKAERKRKEAAGSSKDMESFLVSLSMKARVESIESRNIKRVVQLVNKTNQFNLTSRRHTENDVKNMLGDGAIGRTIRIEDNFGDNGLVGLCIAVPATQSPDGNSSAWEIDTFLLSCRVIGRNVEKYLLADVIEDLPDGAEVLGRFISTERNRVCSDFYKDCGFKPLDDDGTLWQYLKDWNELHKPTYIERD